MIYVTTPYGDNRAKFHFSKPAEPHIELDEFPSGRGIYRVVDGKLVLDSSESQSKSIIESLVEENNLLRAQLKAQLDRSDFIEDCMAELAIQAYQ